MFRTANLRLAAFIEEEKQRVEAATTEDVAEALEAEQGEADRSHVRAFLRDRLAGLDVPFEVRGFVETTWADYMAKLRSEHGEDSDAWKEHGQARSTTCCGASPPRSARRRRRS